MLLMLFSKLRQSAQSDAFRVVCNQLPLRTREAAFVGVYEVVGNVTQHGLFTSLCASNLCDKLDIVGSYPASTPGTKWFNGLRRIDRNRAQIATVTKSSASTTAQVIVRSR